MIDRDTAKPKVASPKAGLMPSPACKTLARPEAVTTRLMPEMLRQRNVRPLLGLSITIPVALLLGTLWVRATNPIPAVATVNGVPIFSDSFNRYQNYTRFLLGAQESQISQEIRSLERDRRYAQRNASNAPLVNRIEFLSFLHRVVENSLSHLPSYTLMQMERSLELQQAAARIGAAPASRQVDAATAALRKRMGGNANFVRFLGRIGVAESDLRTYSIATALVQQDVIHRFVGKLSPIEPEAQAQHILVRTRAAALSLAQRVRSGESFAALARKFSLDDGLSGIPVGKIAAAQHALALRAQRQSSDYNDGWLRDPSQPFRVNQPTWLWPGMTIYAPVDPLVVPVEPSELETVLTMKPNEVRVAPGKRGWYVIKVTWYAWHHLTPSERQLLANQQYRSWTQQVLNAPQQIT